MATAVLSGCIDTHGYGLPFGWHSGKVWRKSTEECARIPNVGAEQMPGFLAQVVQDRHGRAAWQLRLREGKSPLLQRIVVQGNSIKILCQEAKDCAGVYCEQKRLLTEIHEGAMAGVRSQLVSLEAQLLELKSQNCAAQSQNANLVRENFSLMQIEKHTTEIMNSQNVELWKIKSERERTNEQSEREAMEEADAHSQHVR
jgi:hypothetical protein